MNPFPSQRAPTLIRPTLPAPLTFEPGSRFLMVFRLPAKVPTEFCFGGGHPVNFQMVDWFESSPETTNEDLVEFVRGKSYVGPGEHFLILRSNGSTLLVLAK